jgi:co-chaperonin GroES (HSP10)
MKAIGSYIIITPEKEVCQKTKGGLLLNHQNREDLRYKKAIVENIGNEVKGIELGDVVYYDVAASNYIDIDGSLYTVIKEQDIIIVL